MNAPAPAEYPFRHMLLAVDNPDNRLTLIVTDGDKPEAATLLELQDALEAGSHLVLIGRTEAGLAAILAAATRMVRANADPITIH